MQVCLRVFVHMLLHTSTFVCVCVVETIVGSVGRTYGCVLVVVLHALRANPNHISMVTLVPIPINFKYLTKEAYIPETVMKVCGIEVNV